MSLPETEDLLDIAPCGFLSFADDARIVYVNQTLRRLLHYETEDLVGEPIDRLLTVSSRIFFQTHFFPIVKLHGHAEEIYLTLRPNSGEEVAVLVNAVRAEHEHEFLNHCVFMRVHHRKKYEEELLAARRTAEATLLENQQLYEQARAARAEAERADRAKSVFLATMSHEIRTPINAIIGYTELLRMEVRGRLTEGQREFVEGVGASSRHLHGLITNVLDLSKIESGGMSVAHERAQLADAVAMSLPLIEPQAGERSIAILRSCAEDLDYIGDIDRVRQILVNLLSNALKFTPPHGEIRIDCGRATARRPAPHLDGPGPWIFVSVTDTGIGIAADQLESIFEPFVQVEGATPRAGGTGLGLTISRRLARLMGGELTVTSEPGAGSCFTLWLCAARDPDEQRKVSQA